MILKEKEIFNKRSNEKLNKITELDNKVDTGNLVYRYKGKTSNEKFDKCDNAIDLINKLKDGAMTIPAAKINQVKFKSNLGEIKKGNNNNNNNKNQKSKKTQYTILTCFTKQRTVLLNFIIIIL